MRFEAKDYIKGALFVFGLIVYYFTFNKDIEIRIVKLEASHQLLQEIRLDVKKLITRPNMR